MKVFKVISKSLKYLVILILILFIGLIIDDKLWHPLKKDGLKNDIFGEGVSEPEIQTRIDFIGIDMHGKYYDFYKYKLEKEELSKFINSKNFKNYPKFADKVFEPRLKYNKLPEGKTWTSTPIDSISRNKLKHTWLSSNFNSEIESKKFKSSEFLEKEGNFFAFFDGPGIGIYLYVLVPEKSSFFIIRFDI